MINVINDTINKQDIDELIEWLQTYPRLTKGSLTLELESKWAKRVGTRFSVFVNSGSSANLLLLYALAYRNGYPAGAKIVVPAVSWATDLAPVMQLGFEPVLCDCNMDNLALDVKHLKEILSKQCIAAVIVVSALGMPPDLEEIESLTSYHNADLMVDNCESMGSLLNGRDLGTYGIASTFSTYFGHHMSTIEGGFVNTDDKRLYELLVMMRSHGWDRDIKGGNDFIFYVPGFNLRSTDLQAKIGLTQLDKLYETVRIRNRNYELYRQLIKGWKPMTRGYVSNFAYPIIRDDKDDVMGRLKLAGIETRPLIGGSMGKQPFYTRCYGQLDLPNADKVHSNGFYVPNHPGMSVLDVKHIAEVINNKVKQ